MKASLTTLGSVLVACAISASCDKSRSDAQKQPTSDHLQRAEKLGDIPLLAPKVGDWLAYDVEVLVPKGARSPDSPEARRKFVRVSTYQGKTRPAGSLIDTDTFLITSSKDLPEEEYCEIAPDFIAARSSKAAAVATEAFWLDPPCLLVRAGVTGGEVFPVYEVKQPKKGVVIKRMLQVIGRESLTLAGREFNNCIHVLVNGADGGMELQRNYWFAPGVGIVKDERSNYFKDKLLYREKRVLRSMGSSEDIAPF